MLDNYKTRDVPVTMKVLIGIVTLLTAVNTYLAGFTGEISANSENFAQTQSKLESIEKNLKTINTTIKKSVSNTNENSQSISALESDVSNLEDNQSNVRDGLREIDRKIGQIYTVLLGMQKNGN